MSQLGRDGVVLRVIDAARSIPQLDNGLPCADREFARRLHS